ncbi:MAG TPA: BamA/TamA family outer membrane protein [Flavisolibacter sp.]|jgi:outer membrane protein assembly factor BamA|nr:BamA/TamA family outer membrane protein [Flavisolibacter sp.]
MKQQHYFFFLLIGMMAAAGCNPTKRLAANEKLYTGARVDLSGPDLAAREKKVLRSDLQGLTRPKPNTRVLGIPIKLNIYNLFYNKKTTSFFGKLRDKYGEKPVLLSQVDLEKNTKVLQSFLENKGYFHAKVTGDTTVKGKRASATYKAETGNQYKINTVQYPADSSDLGRAINATASGSLLKPGEPFNLDVIKGERIRIDALLKERGFYFFSPEYLLIRTDSTIGNNLVNLYVVVKPETTDQARQIYRINDVFIYSNYSLNRARLDTNLASAINYKGYTIIDRRQRYKPYLFEETMQFDSADIYNRTDHNITLSRLINLNLFKFVKNRFEVVNADSPKLNAYYYLTPLPGKSLRAELTAISRSNNLNGSQVTLSWLNRNVFRSGAHLNFSAYVGSDVQFSGALSGYNTYRTGAEVSLVVPRFVVPFMNLRKRGPFAPRTNIRVGYDILNRRKLYTLNSYRAEYGYTWKVSQEKQHELFPISINYVQPLNVTQEYRNLQDSLPGLERAIEPQFILGSNYQYTYNQLVNGQQKPNAFYFNGLLDLSGNIAGLFTRPNVKEGDTALIAKRAFSQYVKMEVDFRYYRRVGLKSTWANRIDFGYGIPYGNSTQIPYVKQFFIGGNNSLRGFRSRSVGPGTYFPVNSKNIIPDQTGDIKLELNTEFRPHIGGPLYGALFLEGGNIWLKNDSTFTHKPGSQFTGQFLKQLAVDAGVGIRLDITIFVIRFDVGFPLRKPWEQNPWVINQIQFNDPAWRRQNIVYNLAIGYPF